MLRSLLAALIILGIIEMDPSAVEGSIVLGVVAGLFTSAVIFVLGLLITKIVLPWYEALIYKGVDLRGVWTSEYETGNSRYTVQISLEQRGHKVSGAGTMQKSGTGEHDYVQFFVVDGSTWEGFLGINLQSKDRKSLSFVSGLLKIKDRGNSLAGYWVYRSGASEEAEAEELRLVRQG